MGNERNARRYFSDFYPKIKGLAMSIVKLYREYTFKYQYLETSVYQREEDRQAGMMVALLILFLLGLSTALGTVIVAISGDWSSTFLGLLGIAGSLIAAAGARYGIPAAKSRYRAIMDALDI